jgi:hypothetical protein
MQKNGEMHKCKMLDFNKMFNQKVQTGSSPVHKDPAPYERLGQYLTAAYTEAD